MFNSLIYRGVDNLNDFEHFSFDCVLSEKYITTSSLSQEPFLSHDLSPDLYYKTAKQQFFI